MLRTLLLLALASYCLASVPLPSQAETEQNVLVESVIQEKSVEQPIIEIEPIPEPEEPVLEPVLVEKSLNDTAVEPEFCGRCKAQAGDITRLHYNSGEWLNIFVDVSFNCKGRVTKWAFFAKQRGNVFLTVWRPTRTGRAWRLVGKNLVNVCRKGQNVYHVPKRQQIFARKGDVIGVQYPREDSDGDIPTERGVIPYENDDDFPWENPTGLEDHRFAFSRIHNVQVFDEDIDPRKLRRGLRDFKRRAALAAYINVPSNPCRPNPCENGGACIVNNCEERGYECECPPDFIGDNCEYGLECELAGGPLEKLAYDSGTWLNIFTEFRFPCSGRIVEWRFYAKKRGRMYLAAWRPASDGSKSYSLLGKNLIRVRRRGLHSVIINEAEQIEVEAGDVFGIHYPDSLANPHDDRGIIPYVDNRPGGAGLCCGVTEEQLSELYNVNIQDTEIVANQPQDGPHIRGFKRAVALSALVYNPICGLQLGPRSNLSYDSGQWLNVFVNRPVKCDGKLIRWEFYAKLTGRMYLSVWEGNMDDGFTLKGYNEINVDGIGNHAVDVAEADQIDVSSNDVVGIFYPDRPADADTDRGIIPYRNDDDFPWWTSIYKEEEDDEDDDYEFLQLHNVDVQSSSIIGQDYVAGKPYRPFERIPALAAYVDESKHRTVKVL